MNESDSLSIRDLLRVRPGFKLAEFDTQRILAGPSDKEQARDEALAFETQVTALQERLFAASKGGSKQRLLIVLQGMDTSGKGGAVKAFDRITEPLGRHITSFGPPTKEELGHHFLWRIEKGLPPPGTVGIFDRSHYEDVLIVRVRNLVSPDEWEVRYDEINAWEKKWTENGVVFLKCMLHVSKAEQKQRLLDRLDDPTKHWKYDPGDVDERKLWDDYQDAYQAMLDRCSTRHAPWYVIPADHKWHRNWLLSKLVTETLREMDPQYPPTRFDVEVETARLKSS
ncbi:MAG: hypothetical protein R6X18_14065 [Chloroflexota bacterium]|jgi:PPK2 family polyphosphate:nucleotide phosphotransferase